MDRREEIREIVLDMFVTDRSRQDLFSDIADWHLAEIEAAEKRARLEVAREINKRLFGYPKDNATSIRMATDRCNKYIKANQPSTTAEVNTSAAEEIEDTETKLICKDCGGKVVVTGHTTHSYYCEQCKEIKDPKDVEEKQ